MKIVDLSTFRQLFGRAVIQFSGLIYASPNFGFFLN